MSLIEKDTLGLWIRHGSLVLRPLGISRFKAGQNIETQNLPGTPLHGIEKTGDPRIAEFEEVWVHAGHITWPEETHKEGYAQALGKFHYQHPEFDAALPRQRLDFFRHPRSLERHSLPPHSQLTSAGLLRIAVLQEQAALGDELPAGPSRQRGRRPGL